VMNASEQPQRFRIAVRGLAGASLAGAAEVDVDGAAARWMPVAVQLRPSEARAAGPGAHRIEFEITQLAPDSAGLHRSERSTFVVPR
jgi:IG-like fold at C-terminal of FixG, putative oxidoreductase